MLDNVYYYIVLLEIGRYCEWEYLVYSILLGGNGNEI